MSAKQLMHYRSVRLHTVIPPLAFRDRQLRPGAQNREQDYEGYAYSGSDVNG